VSTESSDLALSGSSGNSDSSESEDTIGHHGLFLGLSSDDSDEELKESGLLGSS
jgi:hypothetical protein